MALKASFRHGPTVVAEPLGQQHATRKSRAAMEVNQWCNYVTKNGTDAFAKKKKKNTGGDFTVFSHLLRQEVDSAENEFSGLLALQPFLKSELKCSMHHLPKMPKMTVGGCALGVTTCYKRYTQHTEFTHATKTAASAASQELS